jgi:hypothetical protein
MFKKFFIIFVSCLSFNVFAVDSYGNDNDVPEDINDFSLLNSRVGSQYLETFKQISPVIYKAAVDVSSSYRRNCNRDLTVGQLKIMISNSQKFSYSVQILDEMYLSENEKLLKNYFSIINTVSCDFKYGWGYF